MKESSVRELQQTLRAAGLRATLPRVAVLRHLISAASPLTHGEVADQLAEHGFDRATIYRNLMDLTEAGIVRRTDMGDHAWRFELLQRTREHIDEHAHFICNGCGTVACLPDEAIEVKAVRGVPRSMRKKGVQIQVRGLCNECT